MTPRKPSPATLAARALGALGGAAGTPAQAEAGRRNGARGGRPARWYLYDAGDDLGIVWVHGGRTPSIYDDRGERVLVALPADWRTRAEASWLVPGHGPVDSVAEDGTTARSSRAAGPCGTVRAKTRVDARNGP